MRLILNDLTRGKKTPLEGEPEQIRQELLTRLPWLRARFPRASAPAIISIINHQQNYQVELEPAPAAPPLVKAEQNIESAFEAARWLARGKPLDAKSVRVALWEEDGDEDRAALRAYGLERTTDAVQTVRAWRKLADKAPRAHVKEPVESQHVEAVIPSDGSGAAEAVRRAFANAAVFAVDIGGKHSRGSMIATDPDTRKVLLLKPGAASQSIAAGARDDFSTQSEREACFWHVADLWELGSYFPRADLLLVGNEQFAAIEMLPKKFALLADDNDEHHGRARLVLRRYLEGGAIFRWAVIDYVLGNPDRHGDNMMADPDGTVRLFDEGSALAGDDFDPANDRNSFIPYYLRVWAPPGFNLLSSSEKLRFMPRLGPGDEAALRGWLGRLDADKTSRQISRYGVEQGPSMRRYERVMEAVQGGLPADYIINRLWVGT